MRIREVYLVEYTCEKCDSQEEFIMEEDDIKSVFGAQIECAECGHVNTLEEEV